MNIARGADHPGFGGMSKSGFPGRQRVGGQVPDGISYLALGPIGLSYSFIVPLSDELSKGKFRKNAREGAARSGRTLVLPVCGG